MNRRFLTSAVAIHAGACLIAIVSVGAGAPIANGLMDSSMEGVLPVPSMNEASAHVIEDLPSSSQKELNGDGGAPALSIGVVEFHEEPTFESSFEPELIDEATLAVDAQTDDQTVDHAGDQPTLLRSAGR